MQMSRPKPHKQNTQPAPRPLEDLLLDLIRAHEAMLGAAEVQRLAMRRAEPDALAAARDDMAAACASIAALDEQRRAAVAALAPGRPGATLSSVASSLPEPERTRATELAARLRELIVRAQTEQRRLHAATQAMLRHVRGVMHHVQRGLSHAGVYGRAGRVEPGAAVVSGIDLTR